LGADYIGAALVDRPFASSQTLETIFANWSNFLQLTELLPAADVATALAKDGKYSPTDIIRVPSTADKYNPLRTVKDYPQPSRTEMVDKLPPPEPTTPGPTHHSIGFDATSNSGVKLNVSSYSFSHTSGATANLLVFGDGHYSTNDATRVVNSVTYNGVAMTYVRSDADTDYVGRSTIFFMYAPTTGSAKTVAVTYSTTVSWAGSGVVSYSGAKQSGQPDNHNGAASTTGSTASVTVNTVADNSWVFDVASIYYNGEQTITSQNTFRFNTGLGYNTAAGADTGGPKTPAGAQLMSWTWPTPYYWAISAASFAPALPSSVRFRGVQMQGIKVN